MVQQIASLENKIFTDAWSYESIEDTLKYDYNMAYIAYFLEKEIEIRKISEVNYVNQKLLGYILANNIASETELLRIAVDEEYRGRGIAAKLMKCYLMDISKKCDNAFLEVRDSNLPARKLYEKFGYKIIAKRKKYYSNPSEDGIIYQKTFEKSED